MPDAVRYGGRKPELGEIRRWEAERRDTAAENRNGSGKKSVIIE